MLPTNDEERKRVKLTAIFRLFPNACVALAKHIKAGADKYCGGELRWDRTKSPEELESLLRHVFEQVQNPTCVATAQAIAWRAMANLEKLTEVVANADGSGEPANCEGLPSEPDPRDVAEANLPADLASFLASEGCLDEYLVECGGAVPEDPCDYIDTAFDWEDAPSGADFWLDIDGKWRSHLEAMEDEV